MLRILHKNTKIDKIPPIFKLKDTKAKLENLIKSLNNKNSDPIQDKIVEVATRKAGRPKKIEIKQAVKAQVAKAKEA